MHRPGGAGGRNHKAQQRTMGRGERLPNNKDRHGRKAGISEKGRQDKGALPDMLSRIAHIQVSGEEDKQGRNALHYQGDTRDAQGHELPERGRGWIHTRIREDRPDKPPARLRRLQDRHADRDEKEDEEHHRFNEETRKGNMWAIVHTHTQKNTQKTEYTTFPKKILRLQIAITAVCSLDLYLFLTAQSVKLRKIHKSMYLLKELYIKKKKCFYMVFNMLYGICFRLYLLKCLNRKDNVIR